MRARKWVVGLLLDWALHGFHLLMLVCGVENGHANQDLQLACKARRRCGIAVQPENIIPHLAKLCHNSPVYLRGC